MLLNAGIYSNIETYRAYKWSLGTDVSGASHACKSELVRKRWHQFVADDEDRHSYVTAFSCKHHVYIN